MTKPVKLDAIKVAGEIAALAHDKRELQWMLRYRTVDVERIAEGLTKRAILRPLRKRYAEEKPAARFHKWAASSIVSTIHPDRLRRLLSEN